MLDKKGYQKFQNIISKPITKTRNHNRDYPISYSRLVHE